MNEVKRIDIYHKEYLENLESSLRIRGRELDYKIETNTSEALAIAIANHAFEQKKITQEKIEWILKSFLNDHEEKLILNELAYLIWKDTI